MLSSQRRFHSLADLRNFVKDTLCSYDHLEKSAVQLTERMLVRMGRPCGISFCVHGPRAVKFCAIWETERNTILFYNSTGERIHRTQLAGAPGLAAA